ncbi:MAG: aspartate aminotransferase family protein [Candidatus Rokubacteria bacterium]|nr:aspartate aminotransferase family protein [Candidatus Rokubacteria bacterium]
MSIPHVHPDASVAPSSPREAELLAKANEYSFRGRMDKRTIAGPVFERGRGSVVTDVNGKDYLDFNSGQMCAALGHNNPRIVEAIKESCDTLIHASSSYFNVAEIALAERLGTVVPRPLKKSMFLGSGSDSNEAAVTIAKKYTGGFEVASPHVSFHGFSEASRALTFAGWHAGYGPMIPGSYAMMAPYCYRCPVNQTFPSCELACLKGSMELLDAQSTGNLAAVITEPLFSAGGVIEPPPGWLGAVRTACHDRGMLLIFDEAQTGLGKLGTMFACEQEGVIPDILTLSKHFGGGLEISGVVTTPEIEDVVSSRGLVIGHSHTNDPIACHAGLASLTLIVEDSLPDRAQRVGKSWKTRLEALAAKHEIIGDVRGRGLIQGIELVRDREGKAPHFEAGRGITQHCLARGLLFSLRRNGSVLRFVPPFYTTEEQMDRAAEILDAAITATLDTLAGAR